MSERSSRFGAFSRGAGALGAILAALALLAGCSRSSHEPSEPFLARFADRPPDGSLRLEELIDPVPVTALEQTGCLLDHGWQVAGPATEAECQGPLLRLSPRHRQVILERRVELDADQVDAFVLDSAGHPRQAVTLEWARKGERFGSQRRIEASVPAGSGFGSTRLRVAGHPAWNGEVTGLRLIFTLPDHVKAARVRALATVREIVHPERLEEIASRPWRIDLDNEMRAGWLGLPDSPLRWETVAEPGGELRFAYGILGSCSGEVEFTIDLAGRRSADAGPLFSRRLDCGEQGWQEARVGLPEPTGGATTLELSTDTSGPLDPSAGLPVWAGIELVGGGPPPGLNVVLVSIDTLRPDHLSIYGYPRQTTPRLEQRVSRGGVVFDRAIAAAPWTLPSHTSLFTGIDAHRHGVNHNRGLPESLLTLAEVLHAAGYATHAVTGGGFVHHQYGFGQGFDVYSSFSERMGFADEVEHGVERARETLRGVRDRSFFLFFHTYAVHNPFRPRQPYYWQLTGRSTGGLVDVEMLPSRAEDGFQARRDLVQMRNGRRVERPRELVHDLAVDFYDSGIAYMDHHLDALLQELDDLGLRERTLVVVTSDHGELFGEHGQVNHISLYDENVLVPLVFLTPEHPSGTVRVSEQVRSIDLLPTILELLELPVPEGIDGRSFAPLLDGKRRDQVDATGDAWSYASASNFGISLRRVDGTSYVARNDAWVSGGPREELLATAPGDRERTLAVLRRAVRRELGRSLPGLRIQLHNPGTEPFSVEMWGPPVGATQTKTDAIGPGVLSLREDGTARLTVAPGAEPTTLILEGRSGGEVHLRLDHPQWGSERVDVDAAAVEDRLRYGWSGGEWRTSAVGPLDGGSIEVWWQGPRATDGAEPTDSGLLEQLRALGYLR